LFLRGNKLFGDPGSYGESLVPPWPSVAAGAIRSRMLADANINLTDFAAGKVTHPTLGTPEKPGAFTVLAFHLARRMADGSAEALIQPPADLVISEGEGGKPNEIKLLKPTPPASGLLASSPFTALAILAEATRSKPMSGYWLTQAGWQKYMAGQTPHIDDLIHISQLWRIDHRVGVGLNSETRSAADGKLFSVQAVAMTQCGHPIGIKISKDKNGKVQEESVISDYSVGFIAVVMGAMPPKEGTLRLGGDGRAAALQSIKSHLPAPDYEAIARAGRCRLVLSTPGIFSEGWKLPGMTAEGIFQIGEIKARVTCASVARAEIISGWDLATQQPKTAQRAVPAGSVYWLEDLNATAQALRKLAEQGLWQPAGEDAQRQAEGFNRFFLAAY
jgi:CRISPR-associated protein Cmr3